MDHKEGKKEESREGLNGISLESLLSLSDRREYGEREQIEFLMPLLFGVDPFLGDYRVKTPIPKSRGEII